MNRAIPKGVEGLLLILGGGFLVTKSEAAEHHYRRQATECELNAEKAMKAADQLAGSEWPKIGRRWR
jgi:hypothetical protein